MSEESKSQKGIFEDLVEFFYSYIRRNPFLAAAIVLSVILNSVLGFFNQLISLHSWLRNIGITSPRVYALVLAVGTTASALAYYGIATAMRMAKGEGGDIKRPRVKDLFSHSFVYEIIPISVCCILLNLAGTLISSALGHLFFFDTVGTLIGSIVLGPYWGATIGLLTNICTTIVSPNSFLWSSVNAMLGVLWGTVALHIRLHDDLLNAPLKAVSFGRILGLFILPGVVLSSWATAVIKVSIYGPSHIKLFYESSWVVQLYFLKLFDTTRFLTLAYFIGDVVRNTPDKVVVCSFVMLAMVSRSLSIRTDKTSSWRLRLPLDDIGSGSKIVFALLYVICLFYLLPFEYVIDRNTATAKAITLGLGSWAFLALPLYVALFSLMAQKDNSAILAARGQAKLLREKTYRRHLSAAVESGFLGWVRSIVVAVLLVLLCYFIILGLSHGIFDQQVGQSLIATWSTVRHSLPGVILGFGSGVVLWLLLVIEDKVNNSSEVEAENESKS